MTTFEIFIKKNGLRKNEVAKYLNVSKSYISMLSQGLPLTREKYERLRANKDWDTSMYDNYSFNDEKDQFNVTAKSRPVIVSSSCQTMNFSFNDYLLANRKKLSCIEATTNMSAFDFWYLPLYSEITPHIKVGDYIAMQYVANTAAKLQRPAPKPTEIIFMPGKIYLLSVFDMGVILRYVRSDNGDSVTFQATGNTDITIPKTSIIEVYKAISLLRIEL